MVLLLIALIVIRRRYRSTSPGTRTNEEQPDLIIMALCMQFISLVYCLFVCLFSFLGTLMESIYETMHGNRGNKQREEGSGMSHINRH